MPDNSRASKGTYEGDGYISACQLVALNTRVHKSQKFVFVDPLYASFDHDHFRSCALLSESEAIVFTAKKIFLFCLNDKIHKELDHP